MPRQNVPPKVPTLPRGDEIASYTTYLDAQQAVEALSDRGFPVEQVTIVGTDLKMVERVTGRLTYSRVALAGLASGAWFGLFVGLVLSIFSAGSALPIFAAASIGAGFGLLFSVLSYSLTRGKRDFTTASQIVATSYAILCLRETASQALHILREVNLAGAGTVPTSTLPTHQAPPAGAQPSGAPQPPAPQRPSSPYAPPTTAASTAPVVPPTPPVSSPHVTETGAPRYGVRVVDGKPQLPGTGDKPAD